MAKRVLGIVGCLIARELGVRIGEVRSATLLAAALNVPNDVAEIRATEYYRSGSRNLQIVFSVRTRYHRVSAIAVVVVHDS